MLTSLIWTQLIQKQAGKGNENENSSDLKLSDLWQTTIVDIYHLLCYFEYIFRSQNPEFSK